MNGIDQSLIAKIEYSDRYFDENFEYRHVILPKELAKRFNTLRIQTENEWRGMGIQQSRGWQHYATHRPEPHILLFRRPLGTDPASGKIDPQLEKEAKMKFYEEFGVEPPKGMI